MVFQSIAFVFLFPWIEICLFYIYFFDNWRTCILVYKVFGNFSICSPFPPVIVISPVSGNNYFMSSETSLVLFRLSCPMVVTRQNRAHRSVWFFLLSIFELFLRQIQFRFLKQWALCCAFHMVSVVPTILLCQGTANKTSVTCFESSYNRLLAKKDLSNTRWILTYAMYFL
jgi:hypothetical protein